MSFPTSNPNTELSELRAQVAQLTAQLGERTEQLDERIEHIAWLEEMLALYKAKRFKHSSEKIESLQGRLFDESETEEAMRELQERFEKAQVQKRTQRSIERKARAAARPSEERPKRSPLPKHLRRVHVDVDVSAEDKQAMGDEWSFVGWETSEKLACQGREYFVRSIRRAQYVKNQQDKSAGAINTQGIKVAPVLPVMLPKAIADASLLAKILTGKFVDALSFNRECKVLKREGVQIGYSTVYSYPIQLNERLEPLKHLFYDYVAEQSLWHLDETTLQVLQEPGREPRQKSYLWALRAGPPDAQAVMFHYDGRRNYEALSTWLEKPLESFRGVIVTDEHKPYQCLTDEHAGIAARGGCWAHARRKFTDTIKGRRHGSDAHKMVEMIGTLYQLESQTADLEGEVKLEKRAELIGPWLAEFKTQATAMSETYLKKGMMQKALFYVLNNWGSLTMFMKHAELPLDNNPVESAIRPFALGRRNWLYSASPNGAHASAFMYSLVESAKANGLEPRAYLQGLFERYPLAKTTGERRQLLPMFIKLS